jgi:hypothetical protein
MKWCPCSGCCTDRLRHRREARRSRREHAMALLCAMLSGRSDEANAIVDSARRILEEEGYRPLPVVK